MSKRGEGNRKKVVFFVTFSLKLAPVGGQHGGVGADCALHPLIQTRLGFILSQDVGYCIPVKTAEICYSSKSQAESSSPTSKVTSLASGFSHASPE